VIGVVQGCDDAERPEQCPVGFVFPHHVDVVLFAGAGGKNHAFVGRDAVGNTVLFEAVVTPGGAGLAVAAVVLGKGSLDGNQAGDGAARDFFRARMRAASAASITGRLSRQGMPRACSLAMEAALRVSGLFGMGFSGKGSGGIMPASPVPLI